MKEKYMGQERLMKKKKKKRKFLKVYVTSILKTSWEEIYPNPTDVRN
jgi:hypothetical protein